MMGPGCGAADDVGGGEQETSEDGDHAEADRNGEPGAGRFPRTWWRSHLLDGSPTGRLAGLAGMQSIAARGAALPRPRPRWPLPRVRAGEEAGTDKKPVGVWVLA